MLKLGAQLYTVRDGMKNEKDFDETIRKVSEMGYKYAQLSGYGDVSPEAVKRAQDEYGVKFILTHTPYAQILEDTEKVIENHNIFSCDYVGLGAMPWELYSHSKADDYLRFCETIAPAVEKIKKAGKKFLYHNHRGEFQRYEDHDNKTGWELIWDNTDPEAFLFTLDSYWCHSGGCDAAVWLEDHASRIAVTHLKDARVINQELDLTEVGRGNLNFKSFLEAAQRCNINYHFVEIDYTDWDPFESLRFCREKLMNTGYFEK